MPRAVALLSGGLDSMLAVGILQRQGFEIEALNIRTLFECCQGRAARAAGQLGVRLTVRSVADDYLDVIRQPVYGYGKGVNPCVDCRIYMCKMAKQFMHQVDACLVVTGEVLGQRPMSQRRWQVEVIERKSGLEGRLLRPLSAKLLPPTIPEQQGLADREAFYEFNGRGRGALIRLAERLGIREIPQPSTGCALAQVTFAPRVRDLITAHSNATCWDFELLNVGRHLRIDEHTKAVVGRNEPENAVLGDFFRRADASETALVHPESFLGPDVLLVGQVTNEAVRFAGALILRYSRRFDPADARVRVAHAHGSTVVQARQSEAARSAPLL
jgi:tRNA-specific 2-thiouridylase